MKMLGVSLDRGSQVLRGKEGLCGACFARDVDQDQQVTTVQALLDAWPESVEMGDPDMEITPLSFAASKGNPKVCLLLVGAGANIKTANCMGDTPMKGAQDFKRDNPDKSEAADEVIKILEEAAKPPS